MIDQTSRYFKISTSTLETENADKEVVEIKYLKRRFLPLINDMTTLIEHNVKNEDRLDNIATVYLGDPTQFWLICDSNEVMNPPDVIDPVGKIISISMPKF